MLPCFLRIFLVSWCIHHVLSRPTRRTVRLYRARPTTAAPNPVADLDQSFEGSSLVEEYVPRQENSLGDFRRLFTRRKYPSLYPHLVGLKRDCADCNTLEGVVTVGESRSYSVMQRSRVQAPIADDGFLTTLPITNPFETTTESTTDALTTMEPNVLKAAVSSTSYPETLEPASLLVEDRPYVTAVQRSHLNVDEAVRAPVSTFGKPGTSDVPYQPMRKAAETSSTTVPSASGGVATTLPVNILTNFQPHSITQASSLPTDALVESSSAVINPLTSPVSYSTSLKTATSGSSVTFFRRLPTVPQETSTELITSSTPQTELKTETRVETVSFRENVVVPQRSTERTDSGPVINAEKSYQFTNVHDKSFHHVQVTHLEPGDKKKMPRPNLMYGRPEQNYEVDEALSVKTNGRAHGVQASSAAPDSNKFGYVVEGRDYKKYRVEERTSDGFIVGEYGVVRHDDGSLRGVRYTADSTINPRLIYEALVKFLSL